MAELVGAVGELVPIIEGLVKTFKFFKECKECPEAVQKHAEEAGLAAERSDIILRWVQGGVFQTLSSDDQEVVDRQLSVWKRSLCEYQAEVDFWADALRLAFKRREESLSSGDTLVQASSPTTSDSEKTVSFEKPLVALVNPPTNETACSPASALKKFFLKLFHRFGPKKRYETFYETAKYVVIGEDKMKDLRQRLSTWEGNVERTIMLFISCAQHLGKLPPDVAHDNPIMRFVAEAIARANTTGPSLPDFVQIESTDVCNRLVKRHIDPNMQTGPYQIFMTPNTFPKYPRCMVVDRHPIMAQQNAGSNAVALKLGRLFNDKSWNANREGDPEDGDMLPLEAMVFDQPDHMRSKTCLMLFRIPTQSATPKSLRVQLLEDRAEGKAPRHSITDRLKFALRLATAVFVYHSMGLVHKRLSPETIVIAKRLDAMVAEKHNLGFPYILPNHGTRFDHNYTTRVSDFALMERRGIYMHPRDQQWHRADRYRMRDDIYSLGVCLFEIGFWRSLFVMNAAVGDYDYDDSFVAISRTALASLAAHVSDENVSEKLKFLALLRKDRLMKAAKNDLPSVMGDSYAEVVIACLMAGEDKSPFSTHWQGDDIAGHYEDGDGARESDDITPKPSVELSAKIQYMSLIVEKLKQQHAASLGNVSLE